MGLWGSLHGPCALFGEGHVFLLKAQFLPHMNLRSSAYERNFVNGKLHQVDAAPMLDGEPIAAQG